MIVRAGVHGELFALDAKRWLTVGQRFVRFRERQTQGADAGEWVRSHGAECQRGG